MTFRLFSHKHNLYTNSPLWPSNQRTWSEWVIIPDGGILELIFDGQNNNEELSEIIGYKNHDYKNFTIEPWTGFFDLNCRKIYRGDILKMKSMFDFKSEVIWENGAFWLKALDSEGVDEQFTGAYSKNWTITGNIHNVEFCY